MALGPVRTVHVTTREELDAALDAADRVVVEGDDALLSYAVARASGDPGHRIDIELAAPPSSLVAPMPASPCFDASLQDLAAPPVPMPAGFETILAPPAASPETPSRARSRLRIILPILVLALAVAAGALVVLSRQGGPAVAPSETSPAPPPVAAPPAAVTPPLAHQGAPSADDLIAELSPTGGHGTETRGIAPAKPQAPASQPVVSPKSAAPPATAVDMIQAIAWPAVAVIAILALAIIARQAIATGRNVEFSWKVTEKVSGRVVITKVKNPPARRTRAAPA